MERRVARLSSKIRRMGGVDIIVAHAPVRGLSLIHISEEEAGNTQAAQEITAKQE